MKLWKTCLFHFEEADGIGLISALIVMTKLKVHLDFLDAEQASELVERFAKKKRGKSVIAKCINFLQFRHHVNMHTSREIYLECLTRTRTGQFSNVRGHGPNNISALSGLPYISGIPYIFRQQFKFLEIFYLFQL